MTLIKDTRPYCQDICATANKFFDDTYEELCRNRTTEEDRLTLYIDEHLFRYLLGVAGNIPLYRTPSAVPGGRGNTSLFGHEVTVHLLIPSDELHYRLIVDKAKEHPTYHGRI